MRSDHSGLCCRCVRRNWMAEWYHQPGFIPYRNCFNCREMVKLRTKRAKRKQQKARVLKKVGQNLTNVSLSTGNLNMASGNLGTSRVRVHVLEQDEYIGEISGSTGFATTQYSINPGQSSTFPWGNKIASLFERYQFEYLEFYYRREVSEFATNGSAGKIILSADYDASDSPPTSKQQVEDTIPHVDGMPCVEKLSLVLNPTELLGNPKGRYVRPGAQPSNTDIKTYDAGNLFVSTSGNTNTTAIGELRVKYRVILYVPVLESGSGASGQAGAQFVLTSALGGEAAAATTTYGLLFASATNPIVVQNSIGASVASTGLVTLPSGTYLIESGCSSTDSAADVSALGTVLTYQTTNLNTHYNTASTASTVLESTGSSSAHQVSTALTLPFTWVTSVSGTVVGVGAAATYASGTCLNNGWLRITLL